MRLPTLLVCCLLSASLHAEGFSGKEIQKFIDDAIAAGGGEVVLPPGRHRLAEPLVIKNAGKLRFIGLDAEDTWLLPVKEAGEPFPLLVVEGSSKGLLIAKLTFTTGDSAADFSKTPLVRVMGSGDDAEARPAVHFDRCLFEHHSGPGVLFENAKDSRVTASTFMDLGGPAIHAAGDTEALVLQHNHLTRSGDPAIVFDGETRNGQLTANEIVQAKISITGEGHQLSDNDSDSGS